jgi:adenosylmethionine-8-amino-7-oxononanoate aminotransferase
VTRDEILRLDRAHVWHPYTPMLSWAEEDPIVVYAAEGARLFDADGRSFIDGNSSWGPAALGHAHPRLLKALREQVKKFAHVSLFGVTHEPAVELAAELARVAPADSARSLGHVFFTDNGSTSIECAVRMCTQAWAQMGQPRKRRFLALESAFHGETVGAASLGGVDVFRKPFAGILFDCIRVPSPADGHERAFEALGKAVAGASGSLAAVVVEPVLQAAGGMRIYEAAFLRELRALCDRHEVYLVLDEVFTGYGRTGPMWACQHAGIAPDVMCLGKSFCPILPMAAVVATDKIFQAFDGPRDHAFLYGHTFCGNPLGAAVAREVLAVYDEENVLANAAKKGPIIERAFARLGEIPGVHGARSIGMVGAAELGDGKGYLGELGWKVYDEAKKRGAYLRPLGDTVYVAPPLTIPDSDLESLLAILEESVRACLK